MQPGKEYKSSEMAELLGLKVPRTRVILRTLQEQGKITAIGSNRNRRYVKLVD